MPKLIRITTVPISLHKLLSGQINFMKSNGLDVALACAEGKEIDIIEKQTKLKVTILPYTRTISPLQDLKALYKTYRYLKKEKPQIVHTHTPKVGIVGMLAAWLANVPIRIHTVAGLPLMEATGSKRQLLNAVEKLTYRCANQVYPNSYGLKAFIEQNNFCAPNKLKVIGRGSSNGIDTEQYSPAQVSSSTKQKLTDKYRLKEEHIVFCFVGRLVGDKGINELVRAFTKLYQHNKNVRLLLVGTYEEELDPLEGKITKTIETHTGIITMGWQEDVRPALAISDVFAFPSYREGFPNVVMQAGAMGLPSIVSDINGCNEIIEEGINGTIIPPKDETALYTAMKDLAEDQAKREKYAHAARPIIEERYKQEYVWRELLKEYNFHLSQLEKKK